MSMTNDDEQRWVISRFVEGQIEESIQESSGIGCIKTIDGDSISFSRGTLLFNTLAKLNIGENFFKPSPTDTFVDPAFLSIGTKIIAAVTPRKGAVALMLLKD